MSSFWMHGARQAGCLAPGSGAPSGSRRVLLLWLLLAPSLLFLGAQSKPPAFRGRELEGSITVTITAQATWTDEDNRPYTQSIHRAAKHQVRFNSTEAFPGNPQGVATFRGREVAFAASVQDQGPGGRVLQGSIAQLCPGGRDVSLGQVICAEGAVYLVVLTAQHSYGFTFNSLVVPTGEGEIHVPGFKVGPTPLPPDSETRLSGSQIIDLRQPAPSRRLADSFYADGVDDHVQDLKAVVSWSFEPPNLAEVIVEAEEYKQWIPEGNYKDPSQPGNSITFKASVRQRAEPGARTEKKARLTFRLENISQEKGVCLNWPQEGAGTDNDLQILPEKNAALEVAGPAEARTKGEVAQATLTISSFDYGAWGNLKVTAETSDGKIPVKFQGKQDPVITIPENDTGWHIASAWLRQKEMAGSPDEVDGAQAAGQRAVGDGLTLYAKYRGVVVLEGGSQVFKRLEPKRKIHFLIDDKDLINLSRWERTTDTIAYKLDDTLVKGGALPEQRRQVDFNGGYTGGGRKYAVRLTEIAEQIEPDPLPDKDGNQNGDHPQQLGYTEGTSPRAAVRCRVFPARIRAKIGRIADLIQKGIDDPQSEDGQLLRQAGISTEEARRRLAALTPGRREQLARRLITLVALHESVHACGVPGHGPLAAFGEEWKETEDQTDPACPMQNLDRKSWRVFVLYGILGGDGKLCPLCASQFNVKD